MIRILLAIVAIALIASCGDPDAPSEIIRQPDSGFPPDNLVCPDCPSDETDCDRDGISNPLESRNETDPCSSDSDGDGLADPDELRLGFDPLDSETYDSTPDNEQWVVTACNSIQRKDIAVRSSTSWTAALPAGTSYDVISPGENGWEAALFDANADVAGGIAQIDTTESPENFLLDLDISAAGTVTQRVSNISFRTRNQLQATTIQVELSRAQTAPVGQVAHELLSATAPTGTQPIDISTGGISLLEFHVWMTAISNADGSGITLLIGVSPYEDLNLARELRWELMNFTDPANIAGPDATPQSGCALARQPSGDQSTVFSLQLPQTPIIASIRPYKDGAEVLRGRQNGWDYDPTTNSVKFFGNAAVPAPSMRGSDYAITFEAFEP